MDNALKQKAENVATNTKKVATGCDSVFKVVGAEMGDQDEVLGWYCCATFSGQEYRVIRDLALEKWCGTERVWLPECKLISSTRTKRTVTIAPLFPGYLFVQLPDWLARSFIIEQVKGVDHLMTMAGDPEEPHQLPGILIDELRAFVGQGEHRVVIEGGKIRTGRAINDTQELEPGTHVKVVDGIWVEALYHAPQGQDRAHIWVDLFNRSTLLSVDRGAIVEAA